MSKVADHISISDKEVHLCPCTYPKTYGSKHLCITSAIPLIGESKAWWRVQLRNGWEYDLEDLNIFSLLESFCFIPHDSCYHIAILIRNIILLWLPPLEVPKDLCCVFASLQCCTSIGVWKWPWYGRHGWSLCADAKARGTASGFYHMVVFQRLQPWDSEVKNSQRQAGNRKCSAMKMSMNMKEACSSELFMLWS